MSDITADQVDKKVSDQLIHCQNGFLSKMEYFKMSFRGIVWLVMFGLCCAGGVIALVRSTATLEANVKNIDKKLELIIKLNGSKKEAKNAVPRM